MANPRFHGDRRGVPFNSTFPPPQGTVSASGSSSMGAAPPSSMDIILERLSRLEAKFTDGGGSGGYSHRPDPAPPYGMPPGWKSQAWTPGEPSSHGLDSRQKTTSTLTPGSGTHGVLENRVLEGGPQQLGFRPNPSDLGPQTASGPVHQSWDTSGQRTSPPISSHEPPRLFKMEPPVFDGTDAHSWVTRVQYFFNHILLPEDQRLQ